MSRTESPSVKDIDINMDKSDSTCFSKQTLEEENAILRKQLRQMEGEHKTLKAVLEQKIEILDSQLGEFQEREYNMKKMNETIMGAISDINNKDQNPLANKATKELELAIEHHDKEMQEYRARTSELIKHLEFENKKLKEEGSDNNLRMKELSLHFEKAQLGFNQAINELEQEKASLETKIKRLEEEKQQSRELNDYELIVRVNELKMNNEKAKDEYKRDLQKVKETYEKTLQDLKQTHETDRKSLSAKLDKLQELANFEGSKKDTVRADIEIKYQKEIQTLREKSTEMSIDHTAQVNELQLQNQTANERIEKLESHIKKLKAAVKNSQSVQEQNSVLLKQKLDKAKSVMEHGENLVEENKKYKLQLMELKSQVKKLETSEQKLKDQIFEKENSKLVVKKTLNFDQNVLSDSVQASSLSQSVNQEKSFRQSVPTSQGDGGSVSHSATLPVSSDANIASYDHYSPIRDASSVVIEPLRSASQRHERSTSPILTASHLKSSKSSYEDPTYQTSGNSNRTQDPLESRSQTGRTTNPSPIPIKNLASKLEPSISSTKTQPNKKVPLETSFADHGFAIENELANDSETLKVSMASRHDKDKLNKDKRFNRHIEVDSIPINYTEFVKRSQRSKARTEASGLETGTDTERQFYNNNEKENNVEATRNIEGVSQNTGPQIFFTTSQDENQPLFGTSHFVFEGTQDVQQEENIENEDISTERGIQNKDREEKNKGHLFDHEHHQNAMASIMEKAIDIEDICDIDDQVGLNRMSMNLNFHKKEDLGKLHHREDFEVRPSLMNPMHSVYDSASMDIFQDPQASIDFLSANPRSVLDRDRDREREREKVFSTRCSLSVSRYGGASGENEGKSKNGSRQKIEGRLKDLEWKLKEMELKNQGLRVEKEKVQFEFEKLMSELKEKKAESEGMRASTAGPWDEKKEEKEVALKNEIKFLINKLLKVKNKLEKQSEELNVTKTSNLLSQSQINQSTCNMSHQQQHSNAKKDYSKEYGTLGGIQNMSIMAQSRERENLNPLHMQSMSLSTSQRRSSIQKSICRESWNDMSGISHLNISATRPDNQSKVADKSSIKTSLGVAIENFAKNVRSKSNARYDHNRDSQNISIQNSGSKSRDLDLSSATTRTYKTKGPYILKHEDLNERMEPELTRDVLKPNINVHNYANNSLPKGSNYNDGNLGFSYQRKSTR